MRMPTLAWASLFIPGPLPVHLKPAPPSARCTYLERRAEGGEGEGQHPLTLLPREGPGLGSWRRPQPAPCRQLRALRVQRVCVCGGAFSSTGLCPRIWKSLQPSREGKGVWEGTGESQGIRLQPLGIEAGGSHTGSSPPRVLRLATIRDTPTLGTPSGSPCIGRRPPHHVTLLSNLPSAHTLTDINSQTLYTHFMPAWGRDKDTDDVDKVPGQ